ncbi:hypothetical protein G6F65_020901 [Rhizopus arrhizus]|nr:hypothetical protein G6F65_020901 [Rhizopus arrhizus]
MALTLPCEARGAAVEMLSIVIAMWPPNRSHGFGDQVVGNAHARRAVGGGRRLLEIILELGEIVGGHVLVHDHHVRLDRSQRDGGEVRGLVVGAFRVQDVGDGHGTGRRNADGVAVGRGAHHRLRADAAACADAVFHHYRLSKLAAHFLADQASGDVR